MSVAFVLLGKTNVGFFNANAPNRITVRNVPQRTIGVPGNPEPVGNVNTPNALFTLDVSIEEGHALRSQIMSHPVESDNEITDQIRNLPAVLEIRGTVTDTPSGIDALLVVPGLIDRFAATPRSIETFQLIEDLWQKKTLFDVVTQLKVYRNMAIEAATFPRNRIVGRSLQFNMRLREVQFVSSVQSTTATIDGFGTTDIGAQVPTPVN